MCSLAHMGTSPICSPRTCSMQMGGVWVKYPPLVAGHDNGALYLRDFGLYVGIGQDAGNERLERATCQAANNTSADRPAKTSWRLGVLRGST